MLFEAKNGEKNHLKLFTNENYNHKLSLRKTEISKYFMKKRRIISLDYSIPNPNFLQVDDANIILTNLQSSLISLDAFEMDKYISISIQYINKYQSNATKRNELLNNESINICDIAYRIFTLNNVSELIAYKSSMLILSISFVSQKMTNLLATHDAFTYIVNTSIPKYENNPQIISEIILFLGNTITDGNDNISILDMIFHTKYLNKLCDLLSIAQNMKNEQSYAVRVMVNGIVWNIYLIIDSISKFDEGNNDENIYINQYLDVFTDFATNLLNLIEFYSTMNSNDELETFLQTLFFLSQNDEIAISMIKNDLFIKYSILFEYLFKEDINCESTLILDSKCVEYIVLTFGNIFTQSDELINAYYNDVFGVIFGKLIMRHRIFSQANIKLQCALMRLYGNCAAFPTNTALVNFIGDLERIQIIFKYYTSSEIISDIFFALENIFFVQSYDVVDTYIACGAFTILKSVFSSNTNNDVIILCFKVLLKAVECSKRIVSKEIGKYIENKGIYEDAKKIALQNKNQKVEKIATQFIELFDKEIKKDNLY